MYRRTAALNFEHTHISHAISRHFNVENDSVSRQNIVQSYFENAALLQCHCLGVEKDPKKTKVVLWLGCLELYSSTPHSWMNISRFAIVIHFAPSSLFLYSLHSTATQLPIFHLHSIRINNMKLTRNDAVFENGGGWTSDATHCSKRLCDTRNHIACCAVSSHEKILFIHHLAYLNWYVLFEQQQQ